jgi:hypothetical protein
MPVLSKPSSAARISIMYITVGSLIDVWALVYWIYLSRHPDSASDSAYYWVYGFFFSGLVLGVIGLALGHIGRSARRVELPPAVPPEPTAEPPAAAIPPGAAIPGSPVAQYYTVPGQILVPGRPAAPAVPAVPVARPLDTRPNR